MMFAGNPKDLGITEATATRAGPIRTVGSGFRRPRRTVCRALDAEWP